jgi:hypothetical protein
MLRHHGKTSKDRNRLKLLKKLTIVSAAIYFLQRRRYYRRLFNHFMMQTIQLCLGNYFFINRNLTINNPVFIPRVRNAATWSDYELYDMRIVNRNYVPLLLHALQIPAVYDCKPPSNLIDYFVQI